MPAFWDHWENLNWVVLSRVVLEAIFARAFTLRICDPIQNLHNCLTTSKHKPRKGSGPQTDKQLPQSPFSGYFLDEGILHRLLWIFSSYAPNYWHQKQCCGQCCGTVTIYYGSGSGSGSDFWKVLFPVPVPTFEKLWFRFRFQFLLLKNLRFRFRFRFQLHI